MGHKEQVPAQAQSFSSRSNLSALDSSSLFTLTLFVQVQQFHSLLQGTECPSCAVHEQSSYLKSITLLSTDFLGHNDWVYFRETGILTKHVLNFVISGIFGHYSLLLWAVLCQLCLSNHLPRESFHTTWLSAAVNPWFAHPRCTQLLQMNISVFWDHNSSLPLKLSLWC